MELGADVVIDYKEDHADDKIVDEGPWVQDFELFLFQPSKFDDFIIINRYDIILDCCQQGPDKIKKKGYPHATYITLNSPLLKNVDQHGLIGGSVKNLGDLIKHNIPSKENKSTVKWGFFTPSKKGINMIQELVESGQVGGRNFAGQIIITKRRFLRSFDLQILPVIHKTYSFEDLPKAYERVAEGHLRGKHVIDMKQ